MRITQGAKAIFLLVNHCVTAHTPPVAITPPHHVHGSSSSVRATVIGDFVTELDSGPLRVRDEAPSCNSRARCKKNKIRNPIDDTKCFRCPPGKKVDRTYTTCVGENDQECDKNDRKCKIKKRTKDVARETLRKFWGDIKARFKRNMTSMEPAWEHLNEQRQDKKNQKKLRRIASCLPLVALALGTDAMIDLADGGFSEDYLDNFEQSALANWPKDIDNYEVERVFPDDESDIKSEDYVKPFITIGDGLMMETARKRGLLSAIGSENTGLTTVVEERQDSVPGIEYSDVTALSTTNGDLDKRQIPFLMIIMAFEVIDSIVTSVVAKAGPALAKIGGKLAGRKPTVAKPGARKFSRKEQGVKADEVAKSKNWKNCLKGQEPT